MPELHYVPPIISMVILTLLIKRHTLAMLNFREITAATEPRPPGWDWFRRRFKKAALKCGGFPVWDSLLAQLLFIAHRLRLLGRQRRVFVHHEGKRFLPPLIEGFPKLSDD